MKRKGGANFSMEMVVKVVLGLAVVLMFVSISLGMLNLDIGFGSYASDFLGVRP